MPEKTVGYDRLLVDGEKTSATREERIIKDIKKGHFNTRFLKGPVPMYWFQKATHLPGRDVFKVAMLLWYLKGMKNKGDHQVFPRTT